MLTTQQILALAPDASAAKAGQSLASSRHWQALGADERAAWGECRGSAKEPYRTQIDLAEPAFRCSCPSRKFPCKHGLGLLLLLAGNPATFERVAPPAWVAEWLTRRDQAAQSRTQAAQSGPATPAGSTKREAAATRTASARETKVAAGVAELQRWLRDLVRHGIADAPSRPATFWNSMAARMVDSQAPGLARRVRELGELASSGEGWQSRVVERAAQLHMLLEGYPQLASLPEALQADLRAAIGWSQQKDDLLSAEGLRDHWLVLGQRAEEEDNLRTQRTWLWGVRSGQPALALSFAMFSQPLDRTLPPGATFDAELAFFPSSYPLRALVRERFGVPWAIDHMPGEPSCAAAIAGYAAALARLPWLERFPLALAAVTPEPAGEGWQVRDQHGQALPLARQFAGGWRLMALSGGHALALFGEWDGQALLPLSAWAEGEFRAL